MLCHKTLIFKVTLKIMMMATDRKTDRQLVIDLKVCNSPARKNAKRSSQKGSIILPNQSLPFFPHLIYNNEGTWSLFPPCFS